MPGLLVHVGAGDWNPSRQWNDGINNIPPRSRDAVIPHHQRQYNLTVVSSSLNSPVSQISAPTRRRRRALSVITRRLIPGRQFYTCGAAAAAAMELVTFTVIIDDIAFPDGRTSMGCLGGGG